MREDSEIGKPARHERRGLARVEFKMLAVSRRLIPKICTSTRCSRISGVCCRNDNIETFAGNGSKLLPLSDGGWVTSGYGKRWNSCRSYHAHCRASASVEVQMEVSMSEGDVGAPET